MRIKDDKNLKRENDKGNNKKTNGEYQEITLKDSRFGLKGSCSNKNTNLNHHVSTRENEHLNSGNKNNKWHYIPDTIN